jgi:hypothetical protein
VSKNSIDIQNVSSPERTYYFEQNKINDKQTNKKNPNKQTNKQNHIQVSIQ